MKTSKVLSIILAIAIGLIIALFIKKMDAPNEQTNNAGSQQAQIEQQDDLKNSDNKQITEPKEETPEETKKETLENQTLIDPEPAPSDTEAAESYLIQPTTAEKLTYMITLKTSMGDIELELNAEKAPNTVKNFIQYAEQGHYNGTIFHRVIKGFMIQGGGFEPGMQQKSVGAPILNEANNGLANKKYSIAMARTNDPHSATAQFFINAKDNDFLNFTREAGSGWGYAVFGEVTKGQDIVDAIEAVATGNSQGFGDVPLEDVVIESVTVSD